MEFAAGLINIILIYIIARSLMKIFIQNKEADNKVEGIASKKENPNYKEVAIELVKDEVCNRSIPKEQAHILVKEERKHYFCSWECREEFLKRSS